MGEASGKWGLRKVRAKDFDKNLREFFTKGKERAGCAVKSAAPDVAYARHLTSRKASVFAEATTGQDGKAWSARSFTAWAPFL
jgi:hypothetical protein